MKKINPFDLIIDDTKNARIEHFKNIMLNAGLSIKELRTALKKLQSIGVYF